MKKHSKKRTAEPMVIGMDLGDRSIRLCQMEASSGTIVAESAVETTQAALLQVFGGRPRCRVALEVGTHSPWISRLLEQLGHEVIVANPRRLRLITHSSRKNDVMDARTLAQLARVDPRLLAPIRHRGEAAQADLAVIRVRALLVETRTSLINAARGMAKSFGYRLASTDADQVRVSMLEARPPLEALPPRLMELLRPLVEQIETLTASIREHDQKIAQIAREHYPETELLEQISGVGTLIALTFVLTVDDKQRFAKSRDAGCYAGLRPKHGQSGQKDPQLRITKEGDSYLRQLLVQGAHYILGWRGPDTDLRRWGLKLCERGGKSAKKRAVVAVARKLAILLHRLWVTGEVYEPLRQVRGVAQAA